MKNKVKIPVSYVLEMDDVGWDQGHDLRMLGQASRSGIPRHHAIEDYEFLNQLAKTTGKRVAAALCLGDWDKDNRLRGEVGITHCPETWDRKSEIDTEQFAKYRDTLEEGYVDYMLHGLLHGRYTADGKRINENEYFERETLSDGTVKETFSEDDFRRRLDLFFEIYNSWGFKQKIRGFVVPCGCPKDEEIQRKMCKILKEEYDICYWADNFKFPETLRVVEGVALFKWSHNASYIPWNACDFDPIVLGNIYREDGEENSCLHGSHWTNFLRFNPKLNPDNVERWAKYYERQGEVFGGALANTLAEGVNQLFYHEFAKMTFDGNKIVIDLTEVDNQKLECHENKFMISFKKGTTPESCSGGTITLLEEHNEFDTYMVEHTDSEVTIIVK